MASETQAHPPADHGHDAHGHDAHEHGHFGPEMWVIPEASGLVAEVNEKQRTTPGIFRMVLYAGAALTILGIVGFVLKAMTAGFSDHRAWFYVATFAVCSPPLPANSGRWRRCAFRFTKSHWRRALSRIAEDISCQHRQHPAVIPAFGSRCPTRCG